jgi:hypothetical protein
MKTLVSISDDLAEVIKKHRIKHYPDLTLPKLLVRLLFDDIKQKEVDSK